MPSATTHHSAFGTFQVLCQYQHMQTCLGAIQSLLEQEKKHLPDDLTLQVPIGANGINRASQGAHGRSALQRVLTS